MAQPSKLKNWIGHQQQTGMTTPAFDVAMLIFASALVYYYVYGSSPVLFAVLLLAFALPAFSGIVINQNWRRDPNPRESNSSFTRLGMLSGRSNLESHSATSTDDQQARVQALFVYPVKSCRGVELSTSNVTALGLRYDRLFSWAQLVSKRTDADITHDWRFLTQRECPRLALLETELFVPASTPNVTSTSVSTGGHLIIRFPFESDSIIFGTRTQTIKLSIPLEPDYSTIESLKYTREKITIWKDHPESLNVTNSIDPGDLAKLKYFLGISNPLNLFRVDNENLRSVTRSLPKDRPDEKFKVGFADAFPVHLLNIASISALNDSLPDDSEVKGNLDPRRFRANIYISGPLAYAEDRWMRINMGNALNAHQLSLTHGSPNPINNLEPTEPATYHVACRTARCTLPNVHPNTGIKDRNEPHSTMKRTRQVDEGAKPHPCLGLSMIPLFANGKISVGDEIEILETGERT